MEIKIPKYDPSEGFKYHWENAFEISVGNSNEEILISANKAGLVSLAIQLLTLAQDTVPENTHLHLDEYNSLEKGSKGLIVQKIK